MRDARTIAVYAAEAQRYAAIEMTPDQKGALDLFLSMLPPHAHILDLGCGPGHHAAHMMAQGHRVDAIDATQAFVDAAHVLGVPARLASFDDITGTALYDGIWASFSLLHAPRTSVPRHIAALVQALRPSGAFFLGMKTGTGAARDALGRRYAYFSERELTDMVIAQGLIVTQTAADSAAGLLGSVDPYVLILARKPADHA